MSAKLKDQARRHEQREEWQAAIDTYLRVLKDGEDRDVTELPLYNRVGDLYLRLGRGDDAVRYYEQAATQYAEAGLFNNAIALCNKALRYSPGRLDLLHRLGTYSASQGFLTDARYWFLEFAERAIKRGEPDAAFVALDEFAETSEDPEVRELLARHMHAHERTEHALDEFRKAYTLRVRAGDDEGARALRDEVAGLYPDIELEAEAPAAEPVPDHGYQTRHGLPTLAEADGVRAPAGLPGLEATALADPSDEAADAALSNGRLDGFEETALDDATMAEAEDTESASTDLPGWDEIPGAAAAAGDDAPDATGSDEGGDVQPPPLPGFDPTVPADAEPEPLAFTLPPIAVEMSPMDAPAAVSAPPEADGWVDLADLLGVHEPEEKTRFFVEEADPTGDEDRDFAELLSQFKEKLSEHLAHDDVGSHYDLGLAFKDMGLLDEAISQFQIALRGGGDGRLRIYEELGHCFLLKQQYNVAIKVLSRALQFDHDEEIELIGVNYLLGRAFEEAGQRASAVDAYERVVGLDIGFKDVAERIAKL